MGLRGWMKRLERGAGRHSFVLQDGSTHRYDPDRDGSQLFSYCVTLVCLESGEDPPEEPPIVKALRQARDPIGAVEPFRPENRTAGAFCDPLYLFVNPDESDEDPV
jgi:hypothetical protein